MSRKKFIVIFSRIFILSLPLLAIVLSQVAVNAHLKNFCLFKWIFHHECLGCGLTRAFAALCRFEFVQAYHYNPLIVVVVPALFYIWVLLLKETFRAE